MASSYPSPDSLTITKTGLVYQQKGARLAELVLDLGDKEVEASFNKFKQTAVFSISEELAVFLYSILCRYLDQLSAEGKTVDNLSIQDLREGAYPLQLKVNYQGKEVRKGEIVRLVGTLKCYVYTRAGVPPIAGVTFKPAVPDLTVGHLLA